MWLRASPAWQKKPVMGDEWKKRDVSIMRLIRRDGGEQSTGSEHQQTHSSLEMLEDFLAGVRLLRWQVVAGGLGKREDGERWCLKVLLLLWVQRVPINYFRAVCKKGLQTGPRQVSRAHLTSRQKQKVDTKLEYWVHY